MMKRMTCRWLLTLALMAGLAACSDGTDGAPGEDGRAGQEGAPGPRGAEGSPGGAGPEGSTGNRGPDGRSGDDGEPGALGLDARVEATELDPGEHGCADGGVLLSWFSGDEEEPWSETAICNGEVGAVGDAGAAGEQGPQGQDGPSAAVCAELDPLRITGVDVPEEPLFRGQPSATYTVQTSFAPPAELADSVALRVRTVGLAATLIDDGGGSFRLVPVRVSNTSSSIAIVVSDGCTRATTSLDLAEVLSPDADIRLVHAAPGIDVPVTLRADGEDLAMVAQRTASSPVQLEPGPITLELFIGEEETPAASIENFPVAILGQHTFHVWVDQSGVRLTMVNEPPERAEPDTVDVQVLNLAPLGGTFDVMSVTTGETLASEIAPGELSAVLTLPAGLQHLGLDTSGDGAPDLQFLMPTTIIPSGSTATLTVMDSPWPGELLAVSSDNPNLTRLRHVQGFAVPELPVLLLGEPIEDVTWTTSLDRPWRVSSEEELDGQPTLESASPGGNGASWLDVSFTAPVDGELYWQWQVESEQFFDFLKVCWSAPDNCARSSFDQRIIGGNSRLEALTPWELAWTTPFQAGEEVRVRWLYTKDAGVNWGRDRGWIADLRFLEVAPPLNFPSDGSFIETSPSLAIPDNNPSGVTSAINVSGCGGALLDMAVSVEIPHTWISDLIIELTSPDGVTSRLHNLAGGSNNNVIGVWNTDPPSSGDWTSPPADLSVFRNGPVDGTWTLFVSDNGAGDIGTIESWGLRFTCGD